MIIIMLQGKTESGFEFQIKKAALNNMELVEGFVEVDKGHIEKIPSVLEMLLGNEEKKKIYDHVRTNDGFVPMDSLVKELKQIIEVSKELKN